MPSHFSRTSVHGKSRRISILALRGSIWHRHTAGTYRVKRPSVGPEALRQSMVIKAPKAPFEPPECFQTDFNGMKFRRRCGNTDINGSASCTRTGSAQFARRSMGCDKLYIDQAFWIQCVDAICKEYAIHQNGKRNTHLVDPIGSVKAHTQAPCSILLPPAELDRLPRTIQFMKGTAYAACVLPHDFSGQASSKSGCVATKWF